MVSRFLLLVALVLPVTPALAASVKNTNKAAVVLTIVEEGSRKQVPLDPGATETICPDGCFMTAPNGDRLGLTGTETIEIVGNEAVMK